MNAGFNSCFFYLLQSLPDILFSSPSNYSLYIYCTSISLDADSSPLSIISSVKLQRVIRAFCSIIPYHAFFVSRGLNLQKFLLLSLPNSHLVMGLCLALCHRLGHYTNDRCSLPPPSQKGKQKESKGERLLD